MVFVVHVPVIVDDDLVPMQVVVALPEQEGTPVAISAPATISPTPMDSGSTSGATSAPTNGATANTAASRAAPRMRSACASRRMLIP